MTNEEMLLLAAAGGVGRRQMSHTEVLGDGPSDRHASSIRSLQ